MRIVLRLLAGLASTLLLTVLALSVVTGYLLHSEQGTRWLFELARDFAPGELRADSLRGRLTGPLEIDGLVYRDGELSLTVGRLLLDWRPGELLGGRLHLLALELEQGDLRLPPTQDDGQPAEPFAGLLLPLELVLDSSRITDFRITGPGAGEPVVVNGLELAARAAGETLSIGRLRAEAFDARVELAGELGLAATLPMDLRLDWRYRAEGLPELSGNGSVAGDLAELRVEQELAAPLSSRLKARLFELDKLLRWQAELDLKGSDVGAFAPDFPARLRGRLQADGDLETVRGETRLTLNEPQLGEVELDLAADYRDGVLNAQRLRLATPAGSRIEGSGRYTLNDALGVIDAGLTWTALRWPLAGDEIQVSSDRGNLKIEGRPGDFAYRLALDLQLPQQPPLNIAADGRGNTEGLGLASLAVTLPAGRIDGSGSVAWSPTPAWDLTLAGQGIDPSLFHRDFPGDLALDFTSRGRVEGDGPHAEVKLARLQGSLRGYPLAARGDLRLAGETLTIDALELDSGGSRLAVQGSAGADLDLDWSLRAADLASLWPGLAGSLNGKGRLAGSVEAPRILAELNGGSLGFEGHALRTLALRADLDLGASQKLDLDVTAEDLKSGKLRWQALTMTAKGKRKAHRIELDLRGKDVPTANLAIDAGLDDKNTWSGRLDALTLGLPEAGRWTLEQAVPFSLSATAQRLQGLCLTAGQQGRLCAEFEAKAQQGWKARLSAPAFPLAFFQPWLPTELKLDGRSDLAADFSADAKGHISGVADLTLPAGELAFDLRGDRQRVDFSGGALRARLDGKGARAELKLPLTGLGGIDAALDLPGLQPVNLNPDTQTLNGHLKARIDDLGMAELLVPQLKSVTGHIEADFTLAGKLARPQIKGLAQLKQAALDVPELGLEIRELALGIEAPALDRLTLSGGAASGEGRLTLSGEVELDPERGFPTRLKVKGEDWLAVNIPEATVRVSPDLAIQHDVARSELDGEIRIPFGRIRPRELPASALSSSSDLVVVGGDSEPQEKADPRFHSRLRILFGDKVSFEGFGLRANLSGDLIVIDEPGRPVIGRGRVGIVDGSYRAYGQDLDIRRGYALFADSPVDNPGLDVQAQREAGEVTAGLRVSGTLKAPKMNLFSTPSMTQSEILSYLLTGRAPGEGGGSGVGVSAALQAAGVGSLTSEAGRQLGLEELRVETGNSLAEASLVAGTYLSPRLYVQYVNELAPRETKLRLRYDLNERLQIQTETGRAQGVDLFYTIER